jgi:hypothetical protein
MLTRRRLQRDIFHSLVDLQAAINHSIRQRNHKPKPSSGPPIPTALLKR